MPNGKPGDHPLTDMLVHGLHPFPADIEELLREVLTLDPNFPDGKRLHAEQVEWWTAFSDWEKGRGLDEGRDALRTILEKLRNQE